MSINSMCKDCAKYGNTCKGTECRTWTGCAMKEPSKKFELFICCLGNGLTVCNKAVEEDGDYKQIAHIAECGKITWYVNPRIYVPNSVFLRIKHDADAMRVNWERQLDAMPLVKRYGYLLDQMPHAAFMHVLHMDGTTERKCEYMKTVLLNKSTF